ncbi:MAG: hypothetical protein EBS69_10300 [Verrucomicrobia bacterium]|nr:hypothetical protein [Verrucomicrobiota bacterium]
MVGVGGELIFDFGCWIVGRCESGKVGKCEGEKVRRGLVEGGRWEKGVGNLILGEGGIGWAVESFMSRLRELTTYLPDLSRMVANLPFLILFLWIVFLFSIVVYFSGGIKDLEEKMGKGSITRLQIFLWVTGGVTFVSMVSLAFYLILRPN